MSTFREKLALEPPAPRLMQRTSPCDFHRFSNPKYLVTGDAFWRNFVDDQRKWQTRGRYAGVGINCGHYFAFSREAAVKEMRFYFPNAAPEATNAEVAADIRYAKILNATERDTMQFLFLDLLGLPYSRVTAWLAVLASIKPQGNRFTDYIGGWAYHKAYEGIVFLSARALEPFRSNFDPTVMDGPGWGQWWSQQAEEWDYGVAEALELEVRPRATLYLNAVFFRGPWLVKNLEGYEVTLPGGSVTKGNNPLYDAPDQQVRALMGPEDADRVDQSLRRLEALHSEIGRVAAEMRDLIDRTSVSNQDFGQWVERNVILST